MSKLTKTPVPAKPKRITKASAALVSPSSAPPSIIIPGTSGLIQPLQTSQSTQTWLPMFMNFIGHLTIESKETSQTILGQNLWGSQRRFLTDLSDGMDNGIRDFSVLKSRQLGETAICLAIDLFWMFLHPGIHGCLLIDDEGNRDKMRLILRQYAQSLPRSMRYEIVDDNKTFMSFNVGGKLSVLDFMVAGKRRGTLGASRAYRFLHASEVANYGDENGLENFLQTLSENNPDRLYIKESTANGFNHWHTMWNAAKRDKLTQRAMFIGWWAREDQVIPKSDPRYNVYMNEPWTDEELELKTEVLKESNHVVTNEQLCWYRWRAESRSLDEGMLHQTQPWTSKQSFVLSGRSFFPLRKVERDLDVVLDGKSVQFTAWRYFLGNSFTSTQIEQVYNLQEADLRVWEEPLPWGRYVIGCDPAYGRSDWSDSHAIGVYRCYSDRIIQVAEWGSTEPETFQVTWALAHLASVYEDCYINFEVSGPGVAIKTELDRMKQILRSQSMIEIVKQRGWENVLDGIKWYLYHRPDSLGKGFAYGWKTNLDNKIAIMNEFRDSYTNGLVVIRSSRCLEQMQYIVQDGSDIGPAAKGRKHDDFVFGSVFAHRAWLEWVRPGMIEENYNHERAYEEDMRILKGERPSPVAGIIGSFFKSQEQKRREAENMPWNRERGI